MFFSHGYSRNRILVETLAVDSITPTQPEYHVPYQLFLKADTAKAKPLIVIHELNAILLQKKFLFYCFHIR